MKAIFSFLGIILLLAILVQMAPFLVVAGLIFICISFIWLIIIAAYFVREKIYFKDVPGHITEQGSILQFSKITARWCLSVFFFFLSLIFLTSWTAILFAACCVMTLPIPAVQNFLVSVRVKNTSKIIAICVLFFLGMMFSPADSLVTVQGAPDQGSSSILPAQTQNEKPANPVMVIPSSSESPLTTATPTAEPTAAPTPEPTAEPTPEPTPQPTSAPTTAPAQEQPQGVMVWIASSGNGTTYHSRPQCGNMKKSVQITLADAEARGLPPCKNCH